MTIKLPINWHKTDALVLELLVSCLFIFYFGFWNENESLPWKDKMTFFRCIKLTWEVPQSRRLRDSSVLKWPPLPLWRLFIVKTGQLGPNCLAVPIVQDLLYFSPVASCQGAIIAVIWRLRQWFGTRVDREVLVPEAYSFLESYFSHQDIGWLLTFFPRHRLILWCVPHSSPGIDLGKHLIDV